MWKDGEVKSKLEKHAGVEFGMISDPGADKYDGMQNDRATVWAGGADDVNATLKHHLNIVSLAGEHVYDTAFRNSATVAMATWLPSGKLVTTWAGDSPVFAFVVDSNGKLVRAEMINKLHGADPFLNHIISHCVGGNPKRLESAIAAKPDDFQKVTDFSADIDAGHRIVLVAATDGFLDNTGIQVHRYLGEFGGQRQYQFVQAWADTYNDKYGTNIQSEDDCDQAQQILDMQTRRNLEAYGAAVAQAVASSPEKIAELLQQEAHALVVADSGPDALRWRDNIAAAVVVVDKNTKVPVSVLSSDGVGNESKGASQAVIEAADAYAAQVINKPAQAPRKPSPGP